MTTRTGWTAALALACVAGLSGCDLLSDSGNDGGDTTGGTGGTGVLDKAHSTTGQTWTVLVYMVADNDLEPFAIQDLEEMMRAGTNDKFKIVVQVDRAEGYSSDPVGSVGDFTDTRRLLITSGDAQQLQDLGEKDMADPQVLTDFVQWGLATYPADRTALVFWDHGGGWTGFGFDEQSGKLLSLPDIVAGVKAGLGSHAPLQLLGFDACLMATWEVALSLTPYAEYLIASEETEPGHGWDWSALQLLSQSPASDPVAVGRAVLQGFEAQARDKQTVDNVTLSLIDLYRLGSLSTAMDALAKAFDGTPDQAAAFGRGQDKAQKYGDNPDATRAYNLVDVADLGATTAVGSPAVKALQAQLDSAVTNAVVAHLEGSARARSRGLAVYFPPSAAAYRSSYDDLPAAANWRAFLKRFFGTSAVDPVFTNAQKLADVTVASGKMTLRGSLDPATTSGVTATTLYDGVVQGNTLLFYSEEPASLSGDTVEGSWDYTVLHVTQGSASGPAYATFSSIDANTLGLDLLFGYRKAPGAAEQDCLEQIVFKFDSSGNATLSSDTFYVLTNGVAGELTPAAGSTLMPKLRSYNLDTSVETLIDGAATAFTATTTGGKSSFELGLTWVPLATGTQAAGLLTAVNAKGAGDAVVGLSNAP